MELDPQVAFERLFGSGGSDARERAARREQRRSILDSVSQSLPTFKKSLGPADRARMDEWETDIREIERRLDLAKKSTGRPTIPASSLRPASRSPSTNTSSSTPI